MLFALLLFIISFDGAKAPVPLLLDCHPERNADRQSCEARDCIWAKPKPALALKNAPWCTMKDGIGYVNVSSSESVINLRKNNGPRNPWGADFEEIQMKSEYIGKTLNVKIFVEGRFEPPVNLPREPSKSEDSLQLYTNVSDDIFYFVVKRMSTGRSLFNTSVGGLIFSDKFIQIVAILPSDKMYGLGEQVHLTLKHDFSAYQTWPMYARDEFPFTEYVDTKNLYGVHPFYMILEPDGKAHGVLIFNSNAQEVTTAPGPALIYRTIGGILDLYFFPGPTPAEVTQQYLGFIGRPVLPAYWGLGFQISRWGYKDFDELKKVVSRNINAGVPLEVVVFDIDYMDRYKDFTLNPNWKGIPEYVEMLRSKGMRTIFLFDPAVQVDYEPFERAMQMKARFIEWERDDQVMRSIQDQYPLVKDTKIMLGVVWPDHHIAYPDFFDPTNSTEKWWIDEMVRFHKLVPFDGIWIDMNEPSSFGTNEAEPWYFDNEDHPNLPPLQCPTNSTASEWDKPPYETHAVYSFEAGQSLATKTLCLLAVQADGKERFYNVKSLYGWSHARSTRPAQHAATGKRGIVISRSTFVSAGRFTGHWLGDNTATWTDLQHAVIGVQEFNMFGIPYVGSDLCGFIDHPTEELCLRWQQVGAFHPFMRNHNIQHAPAQDPAVWPSVVAATVKATLFRYKYLPYLFSLHFLASMEGVTVVRPLFYEYPDDEETHDLGHQFLWGSSMLIAPVVHEKAKSVHVYLPEDTWYSLFDHAYGQSMRGGYQKFPAPWTSLIPVFVRGGSILPRQAPNMTTAASRQNPFELLIAPHRQRGQNLAEGFLFWDDGESIVESFDTHNFYHWAFAYTGDRNGASLTINTKRQAKSLPIPTLDTIEIFNYVHSPDFNSFTINGTKVDINVQSSHYDSVTKIMYISSEKLIDMAKGGTIALSWKHAKEGTSERKAEKGTRRVKLEEPEKSELTRTLLLTNQTNEGGGDGTLAELLKMKWSKIQFVQEKKEKKVYDFYT